MSVLLTLLLSFLFTLSSAVRPEAEASLMQLRQSVSPPCDPRSTANLRSPCTGTSGNYLPRVSWSESLAASSDTHVRSCPLFFAPRSILPPDAVQALFLSPSTESAAQLVTKAFAKWQQDGKSYDPISGFAYSGDTQVYKALVSTTVRQFACSVKVDCLGGPTGSFGVLHCIFVSAPGAGPSYPALVVDAPLLAEFRTNALKLINGARYAVERTWHSKLPALTWSDDLADLAAKHVATLSGRERVFRADLSFNGAPVGELVWRRRSIFANPAGHAILAWFKKGLHYRLRPNTCDRSVCGEFTQLVHEDVKQVGCAQAWNGGYTYVVCNFDFKAADGRKHIMRPIALK